MEYTLWNTLKYTVVMANTVCTLRCRDCVTATPFQKHKHNYPLEELKADIKRYFEVVNIPLEHFDFIGGEPLLHPALPELLQWCYEQYSDRFEELRVLTNGTILFSEKLLSVCRNIKIRFLIDQYGELSKHADDDIRLLEENHIPYRITRFDGNDEQSNDWISFGDFTYRDYDEAALERLQNDCCELIGSSDIIMRHHLHLSNGRLYVCDRQIAAPEEVPMDGADFVDLRSGEPIEKMRDKIKSFKLHTLACCQYCNGFVLDKNKRVGVPVAVQLPRGNEE